MLLDQLDLHGAGLCDGDLDSDRAHLVTIVGPLLHDGQNMEGTDAEGPHPRSGGDENVVDDVTELEEPELAVGPRLFEQRMSRWRHCVGVHAASALLGVGFISYLYISPYPARSRSLHRATPAKSTANTPNIAMSKNHVDAECCQCESCAIPTTRLLRSAVDAVAAKPHRPGMIHAMVSSAGRPVTGMNPPANTSCVTSAAANSMMT